jgi:putative tryptophan/tyrosine transport system substrate-binding protein
MSIRRREFITLLGGAGAWPVTARAQQPKMPVIGFLGTRSPDDHAAALVAFRRGLGETAYIEGQNVAIEYRWAEGHSDRLPALAADLVRRQVAVIATGGGSPATLAAKAATTAIPIIFTVGVDPVRAGFVASLNRPGGNLTGVSFLTTELGAKRLGILLDLVPQTRKVAYLVDPANPAATEIKDDAHAAAGTLGRQVVFLEARTERDFDPAFATFAQSQADALVVGTDALFTGNSEKLVALAARYKIPAIYAYREYIAEGGLISYGASLGDAYRQAGVYAGQILKGAKSGDLPVQQPTKFELVINLKTAKALGLTVPPSLLAIADEVIE